VKEKLCMTAEEAWMGGKGDEKKTQEGDTAKKKPVLKKPKTRKEKNLVRAQRRIRGEIQQVGRKKSMSTGGGKNLR